MPSAKQIAWRKKFARMAKSGKFKKSTKSKSTPKKKNSSQETLKRRIAHLEKIIKSNKYGFDSLARHDEGEKFDLEMAKKKLKKQMEYT